MTIQEQFHNLLNSKKPIVNGNLIAMMTETGNFIYVKDLIKQIEEQRKEIERLNKMIEEYEDGEMFEEANDS